MTRRRVTFLVFPGFHVLDLAVLTVFGVANEQKGGPFYDLNIVSRHGGVIRSSVGATLDSGPYRDDATAGDTVMVFGSSQPGPMDRDVLDMLRRATAGARRIGMVCASAYLLAAAGLLDGRRIAIHTKWAQHVQRHHPALTVVPDRVYVRDGAYWSSAGMMASIDMAIAMVEEDLGTETALAVARHMVMYHWRAGAHAQSSSLLHMAPRSGGIKAALLYARQNLRSPLTIDELAHQAHMSRRHFTRIFRAETGHSPARAIALMRAEVARTLLEGSNLPLETVARDAGFGSAEQMRQAVVRAYGESPQDLRRGVRAA